MKILYDIFMNQDATQIEINPLALDSDGNVVCMDAKFNFDEDKSLQEAVKEWKIQGVPTYMMYDEKGECTKMFTTGLPDKLGSALYLFLT